MAIDPGTVGEVLAGAVSGTTEVTVGLSEQIARLADQLRQLQTASQAATESAIGGSRQGGSSPGSSGSSIGSTLLDVFGAGLGLSPLISGIASLFGGEESSAAPPPFVRFALPPSIQVNGGVRESGGQPYPVDYSQGGQPRITQTTSPAKITVQVQAMDSKSFLDHSGDIAMAVRQAMLESSVLNDVVREA